MAGLCNIVLIGNVGADATSRQVNDRYAVGFSLGVTDNYTDRNGQKQSKTTWFSVTIFTKNADYASYIHKGSMVAVSADKISSRTYVDRNGQTQATLDVTANRIQLLDKKQDGQTAQPVQKQPVQQNTAMPTSDDDDLPPFLR